jgi:formamidopyrimidine-DNA glycosylase
MPEVCEVYLTTFYLNQKLKNKSIKSIKKISGRYTKKELPGIDIIKPVMPLKITKIDSKGKFMWFELKDKHKNNVFLLITLGLEGQWSMMDIDHTRIKFKIVDSSNNKYILNFADQRNFGTLKFITTRSELDNKLNMLAPDFLKTNFTNTEFKNRICNYLSTPARHNNKIVTVLMEQSIKTGIGSGIGNYLVAEILYRAKISPHTTIGALYKNSSKIKKLSKTIKYVVKLCYLTNKTRYVQHFKQLLTKNIPDFHKNINIKKDIFIYFVYRQKKDPNGHIVIGEKIIKGRTTYWVPAIQK